MKRIHITEVGKTASLAGSPQRERRWQIIKLHDGVSLADYEINTSKKGHEALRRRMRDGWVELR